MSPDKDLDPPAHRSRETVPRSARRSGAIRAVARGRDAVSVRGVLPQAPAPVCPADRGQTALDADGASYRCGTCGARYAVEAGVVRFLDHDDPFYEGRYLNTILWLPRRDRAPWSWPLWLIASGYVWAVRRHVPAG